MILASILLILRIWAVLKTSVASMTSVDMITSLASMTSTALLASENKKNSTHFTYWVISLALGTSAASMTSTASTTSVASLTSPASIYLKINEIDVSINPGTKMTYSSLLMWLGMSKIHYFIDFLAPFILEAVEDRDVTFNQIKGSYIKFPLLRIPKPPSN